MSVLLAEKCNSLSLSHFVNIVHNGFLIMYCIVSYCVLCMYLICYLYTIVLTKVTRNKDIYICKIPKEYSEVVVLEKDCFLSEITETQWLELLIAQTHFDTPFQVRASEVLLYI